MRRTLLFLLFSILPLQAEYGHLSGYPLSYFLHTTHAVTLNDGSERHYISIGYLARDWDDIADHIRSIQVVDAAHRQWIDARSAHYVVNSRAPGTLTRYGKFAFAQRSDAEAFIAKEGGDIRRFDFTIYMAERDIREDDIWLKQRREIREYPRGRNVESVLCQQPIDPSPFPSLLSLKTHLKTAQPCGPLYEFDLHSLALYLWEVKREGKELVHDAHRGIDVPEDAKCPICGMFVAKYPRWAALMQIKQDSGFVTHYFDGIKDMMKFYHELPDTKAITTIEATDYYTQQAIDARTAWYVLHSQVYGPMGHEPIPFASREKAERFLKEREGRKIVPFEDLSAQTIWALDGVKVE